MSNEPAPAPAPAPSPSPAPSPAPAPAPAPSPSPAPAPSPAPSPAPTLANDPGLPPAAPSAFPENWRGMFAGDDAAAAEDLKKYTDPAAIYKSLRQLQADMSAGKLKRVSTLPKDATPEQVAEFRKSQGLPENPEAFVKGLKLPDGVVPGQQDQQLLEGFAKLAMEAGLNQEQFNQNVSWFYGMQDSMRQQMAERDGDGKMSAQAELVAEWGASDYKVNMNAVGTLLASMPQELHDQLLTARTPDGQMLGNTAAFNRWAAQIARELNPAATIVPPGDGNAAKTIGDEIKQIEASMYDEKGNPNRAYWGDEAKQARYRELIDAQQKMGAKSPAAA